MNIFKLQLTVFLISAGLAALAAWLVDGDIRTFCKFTFGLGLGAEFALLLYLVVTLLMNEGR